MKQTTLLLILASALVGGALVGACPGAQVKGNNSGEVNVVLRRIDVVEADFDKMKLNVVLAVENGTGDDVSVSADGTIAIVGEGKDEDDSDAKKDDKPAEGEGDDSAKVPEEESKPSGASPVATFNSSCPRATEPRIAPRPGGLALLEVLRAGLEDLLVQRLVARVGEALLEGVVGLLLESRRNAVESLTPNVPVHSIVTMDQIVKRSMANRRFSLELLGVFATAALLLAAIGIYGVMSYSFSQRTHEVGVRVALGAQRLDIWRMAVGEGMLVVAIGLIIGIAGALAVTRVFQSMLFGVDATDPVTLAVVAGILAAVALLACYIPARRATRVDPLVALRVD